MAKALNSLRPAVDAAGLIDQLRELEDLKSSIAGVQAQITVAIDVAERHAQALAEVPAAERGKAVGAQIALARRESPARGSRLLGLAKALVTEMPHTLAALHQGQLNEWRATLLVRETACLSSADRIAVDEELSADTGTFTGCGDKTIVAAAKAAAYRKDPRLSGMLVWNIQDFALTPVFAGGSIRRQVPGIVIVRGINQKGLFTYGGRAKPAAATVRRLFKGR